MERNKLEMYTNMVKIGSGVYGEVFKANKDGKTVALKILDSDQTSEIQKEIRVLKDISCHPGIVCYYGSQIINDKVYIEMEYIDGWNLQQFADQKRSDSNFIRYMFDIIYDLTSALIYIHSKNIIHKDIKPENIMIALPKYQPKLIDFGLSCYERYAKKCKNRSKTCCLGIGGTPYFMAPETILTRVAYPESDVWSLAASVYTVITNKYVFQLKKETFHALQIAAERSIELTSTGNAAMDELLRKMLTENFSDRMKIENIQPFIKQNRPYLVQQKYLETRVQIKQ